jgi:hypothetical protein
MDETEVATVLRDPLALELMASQIPARLAYVGIDGAPRAIPIGFLWTGRHFVLCTSPISPKVRALTSSPAVALTIDTESFPPHVLLVRGVVDIDIVDGIPPEYLEASRKVIPAEGWDDFEAGVRAMYKQMARIRITPTWAKILDFETRIPDFMHRLMAEM